ncbi:hypothetical protein [Sphaerisporangium sp. TRM90804]|uniref:hypothetical protein n=1 Tax=Sphaerisporangium sp. TRM90804 TaxID=3031113 RepID=UPI0024494ED5|nr:hypothetical protein [Sphaerisporangium sp. TRM90804]MDH2425092.1 hypothetical protein [Sphaerisporangium sp. TRM90804]
MGNGNGNGRSAFKYEGFHLDKDWPGGAGGDTIDIEPNPVKNLLKALEEDVEILKGVRAGTPGHLRAYGKVTSAHVGEWDAAQALGMVFNQGHMAMTASYDKLVAQYEAAIVVIKAAVANIEKAEASSDVGLQNLT